MQGASWIALFERIPAKLHDTLALTLVTGAEIIMQSLLRLESDFAIMRGRMAGSTDAGRVIGKAEDEAIKQHQFAELLNLLEIACALRIRNVLTGVSRELLTEYLDDVMRLLNTSDDAKERLEALIHSKTTFKYLRLYLKYLRKHPRRTWHR